MSTIPQDDNRTMHVYAIRARWTPYVKIGITSNPDGRFNRAQTDCPHDLRRFMLVECPRAYDVEQWVHERLRSRRMRGEWFRIFLDATVYNAIQEALRLLDRGELPRAIPFNRFGNQSSVIHEQRYTDQEWLDRFANERGKDVVIEWAVDHGLTKTEIRSLVRGDNAAIGQAVEAARQRLGITEAPRVIPLSERGAPPRPLALDSDLHYAPPPR